MEPQLRVGDRVQLVGTNKTGKCRFVGAVPFSDGVWVGLELSDASGRNDGSVQGRRYFSCKPRHGLFVRVSSCVKVAVASATTPTRPTGFVPEQQHSGGRALPLEGSSLSTADAMLERIQSILGSAREPHTSSSVDSARTLPLPLTISSSASMISVPPPPQLPPPNVSAATAIDSAVLLKEVLESPALQERIKKLVTAAVTAAAPAPAPAPAPSLETSALVAGLDGRVAALEKTLDSIKTGLDNIQLLVGSAGVGVAPKAGRTPPRVARDVGSETDGGEAQSADNAAEVARLREALEVVSQLTREAQSGILAERAKRKEETEALLAQLAKVKGPSPSSSPAR